jgi:surface protein
LKRPVQKLFALSCVLLFLLGCNSSLAVFLPTDRRSFEIESDTKLVTSNGIDLKWSSNPKAQSYSISVSKDDSCQNPLFTQSDISETRYFLDFLDEGEYFLCVYAHRGNTRLAAKNNGLSFIVDRTRPMITTPFDVKVETQAFHPALSISDLTQTSIVWSQMSGEGTIEFDNSHAHSPLITANKNGMYKIKATVTDEVGNVSEQIYQFYWDGSTGSGSSFVSLSYSGYAADGFITLSEQLNSGPIWILTQVGAESVAYTKPLEDSSGSLLCNSSQIYDQTTIASALSLPLDRVYAICVELKDEAGRKIYGKSPAVLRDILPPTISSFTLANAAADGYITDAEKASNLPLFTLTASDYSAVAYTPVLDNTGGAMNCDNSQTYSIATVANISTLTTDGTFAVCVRLTDSSGNIVFDKSPSFVRDVTAPAVTVTSLSTLDMTPALAGTVNDATATVIITVHNQTYTAINNANGTWSVADNTLSMIGTGTYSVTAVATDLRGNTRTDSSSNELTITAPAFVSTWKTDNAGVSDSQSVMLPLDSSGIYNFVVQWGDGTDDTINAWNQPAVTHSYSTPGTYTITISGSLLGWRFANAGDRLKILDISNWGALRVGNTGASFQGASNMTITATDVLNLTGLTNLSWMFENCSSLTTVPNMGQWDVSSVTTTHAMFRGATNYNSNIGAWTTSALVSSDQMFKNAEKFNQPLNSWDTSKIFDFGGMFEGALLFNGDITGWNTASAQVMGSMFQNARSFDQPIGNWNVQNVYNFSGMFAGAWVFNQPLNTWVTNSATSMRSMFLDAFAFNRPLNSWNTANVTAMDEMFHQAKAFNSDISTWNTALVTHMGGMFAQAIKFNQNIGSWNVSNVENMSYMFFGAWEFNQPLTNWNVAKVKTMASTFEYAYAFNGDVSIWDVTNVTTMLFMFHGCNVFNQDLGAWSPIAVKDMINMLKFSGMSQTNYSSTLVGWSGKSLQSNVNLDLGTIKYLPSATAARDSIINTFHWVISDGGLGP